MGFKAKARKNKPQNADKGAEKKKSSAGEVPCAVKSCDRFADKKLGGRSLSFDDATEMWGSGNFVSTKAVFEYANPVIVRGRKKTRTMICIDFTFTFTFVS